MWRTATGEGLAPNLYLKERCFFHSGAGLHFLIVMPERHLVIVHRVNTDALGPYPKAHQVGRLFWMILDAAREKAIGRNPSLEAAEGTHLTGEDLKAVILSNRFQVDILFGLIEGGDRVLTVQFHNNGDLSLVDNTGFKEVGKWSLRSSRLCVELEDLQECYTVIEDKVSVKLYDSTDTLFKSLSALTR